MLDSVIRPSHDLAIDMSTVTLSPRFQVVIPQQVCQSLGISPGEKLRVISHAGRVELVPVRSMKSLRGFLKGMDTAIDREKNRV